MSTNENSTFDVDLDPLVNLLGETPKYFKHQDGGIYVLFGQGQHTKDLTETTAYMHVWPFEQKLWFRDADEFHDGRFTETDMESVIKMIKSNDRATAQQLVVEAKASRRAKQA